MGNKRLSGLVYKPSLKQAKKRIPFNEIPGKNQKAPWISVGASHMIEQTTDLDVLQFVEDNNLWDNMDDLWWTCLFQGSNMVVKEVASSALFWVLGQDGFMAYGWPLIYEKHSSGKYLHFLPVLKGDGACMAQFHLTDPKQFQAVGFKFCGPKVQYLKNGGMSRELQPNSQSMHMVQQGDFKPILEFAASRAFFKLDLPLLRKIQKIVDAQSFDASDDLFLTVFKLCSKYLGVRRKH